MPIPYLATSDGAEHWEMQPHRVLYKKVGHESGSLIHMWVPQRVNLVPVHQIALT